MQTYTVRFTGKLDAGTLTVQKNFNGNKYITTKYKYKYKYQVPHLWRLRLGRPHPDTAGGAYDAPPDLLVG